MYIISIQLITLTSQQVNTPQKKKLSHGTTLVNNLDTQKSYIIRWENECVKYWNLTMNCSHHLITYLTTNSNVLYIYILVTVAILMAK